MAKAILTRDETKGLELFAMLAEHSELEEAELLDACIDNKLDEKRGYTGLDKQALYRKTNGKCAYCGEKLQRGFHGDHVIPHSRGGRTTIANGFGACPSCNLSKGAKIW